jgi:hypothetical protein
MSRSERNVFFERLIALRVGYGRDADDTSGVLPIEDAIAYVDAVMTAIQVEEDLEMTIVAAAGAAAREPGASDARRPAEGSAPPFASAPPDVQRAERIARLARFFDPSGRQPFDRS